MSIVIYKGKPFERADLNAMSGPELVEFHNQLSDKPTKRFATKKAGVDRTWKLLEAYGEKSKAAAKAASAPKAKAKSAGAPKKRKSAGTNLPAPGFAPLACREGSKQAILVDMLSRKEGATMEQLIDGLAGGKRPWQEATVRSGFGWDLKQKGYGVKSEFVDGVEVFHLVVPAGKSIPAHRPLKGVPKADARQRRLEA